MKRREHDIYEDDTKFLVDEDETDEEKEDETRKFWMHGPTLVHKLEAGIIQGWQSEFVVNMTNVKAPTLSFTNMRILDKKHATQIYERLLTRQSVSTLTLRPMSYYDGHLGELLDFNIRGGRDQFLKF